VPALTTLFAVTAGADEMLLRALNLAGMNGVVDAIMVLITLAGTAYVLAFLTIPIWWSGHREAAFDVLVLIGITLVVTEGIKFAVARPRPCEALSDIRTIAGFGCSSEFDPAFPSGHASRAFALATFLAVRFRRRAGLSAFVFAGLVGLSRIYLGVHWPSDVLGGALLGVGLAVLVEIVSRRVGGYQRIRQRIVEAIPHFPRRSA